MKSELTQAEIKNLLEYDEKTGVFTHAKARSGVSVGKIAGCKNTLGYVVIRINRNLYYAHRLAWLYCFGEHPEFEIDHINGDTGDNRISNLRNATHQENLKNMRLSKANSTGFTGVYLDKRRGLYKAQIKRNGVDVFLGYFKTKEDAAIAREMANKEFNYHPLHGTDKERPL